MLFIGVTFLSQTRTRRILISFAGEHDVVVHMAAGEHDVVVHMAAGEHDVVVHMAACD